MEPADLVLKLLEDPFKPASEGVKAPGLAYLRSRFNKHMTERGWLPVVIRVSPRFKAQLRREQRAIYKPEWLRSPQQQRRGERRGDLRFKCGVIRTDRSLKLQQVRFDPAC